MSTKLNSGFMLAELKSSINVSMVEIEELKKQIVRKETLQMELFDKIAKLERRAESFDKERSNFEEAIMVLERAVFEKDECIRELKGKNSEIMKHQELMKLQLLRQDSEIVLLNNKLTYRIEEVDGFKEKLHTIIKHKYSECELLKEKLDILEVSYNIKQSEFIHLFNINLKLKDKLNKAQLNSSNSDYMLSPYNTKSLFNEFNSKNQILIDKVKDLEASLNEKVHTEEQLLENNKKLVEEINTLKSKLKNVVKLNKLTNGLSLIDFLQKLRKKQSCNDESEEAISINKRTHSSTCLSVSSLNGCYIKSKLKKSIDQSTTMDGKISNASITPMLSSPEAGKQEAKKYVNKDTITTTANEKILLDKVKGDNSDHVFEIVLKKNVFTTDNNNNTGTNAGIQNLIENPCNTTVKLVQQKIEKVEEFNDDEKSEIEKNLEKVKENRKLNVRKSNSGKIINILEETLSNHTISNIPPAPKLPSGSVHKIKEKSMKNEILLKTINKKSTIDSTPIASISELQRILNQKIVFHRMLNDKQNPTDDDGQMHLIQNSLNKANDTLKKIEDRNKARLNT